MDEMKQMAMLNELGGSDDLKRLMLKALSDADDGDDIFVSSILDAAILL